MSFHSWLQNLQSALAPRRGERHHRQQRSFQVTSHQLSLEVLEDRLTLSFVGGGIVQTYPSGVVWAPPPPLVGDFTSDGIPDKISSTWHEVVIRPGRGDGTFGTPITTSIAPTPGAPLLAVADFNGDGRLDVFTAGFFDFESPSIANVLLGQGNGHFGLPETFYLGVSPGMIGTGDFLGTGRTDVVIEGTYFDDQLGYDQSGFEMLFNDFSPPPPATPNLSIDDVTLKEGNAGAVSARFNVTLSAASSEPVTVAYATGDGTAMADSDYQAASGTLTFAAGETSKTVSVLVNGDRVAEPNETFFFNLGSATNANIADDQGVGTIVDDEPRISIGDVSKSEGKKNQTTLFTFTVTLSAPYDQPVTMSFKTTDGTAKTSDDDYIAKTGTLTFAPGETTKTITIEVKGDSKKEANETFYLDLFGNSGNSLFTKNRGLGTILNDD